MVRIASEEISDKEEVIPIQDLLWETGIRVICLGGARDKYVFKKQKKQKSENRIDTY